MNEDPSEETEYDRINALFAEERMRRKENEERVRLQAALGAGFREIVCEMSTGRYRDAIINASKGIRRRFRPGVAREPQVAEEGQLRAMLEYVPPDNCADFKEFVPMVKKFQRRAGIKNSPPTDPELFRWDRYLDFETSMCPPDELLRITEVMDKIGLALYYTQAAMLINESQGRQKVRLGQERDNLKFVCFVAAIETILCILKDHPDRSEELIGVTFREPFPFPRLSEWIRLSGISRSSFYSYWGHIHDTALANTGPILDWMLTTLPTAFTEDRKTVGTLSKSQAKLLASIRDWQNEPDIEL